MPGLWAGSSADRWVSDTTPSRERHDSHTAREGEIWQWMTRAAGLYPIRQKYEGRPSCRKPSTDPHLLLLFSTMPLGQ